MRKLMLLSLCAACSSGGSTAHSSAAAVANGSLQGRRAFPADNAWNTDISSAPVDLNSSTLIASCGLRNLHQDFGTTYNGAPNGIPYAVVHGAQPKVPVTFDYPDESDPGPYPTPPDAPIEGGSNASGDRHVLVVDIDAWKLYELFDAHPINGGTHARAPQSELRYERLLTHGARGSSRDDEVRYAARRQRQRMVLSGRAGSAMERRRAGDVLAGTILGIRGRHTLNAEDAAAARTVSSAAASTESAPPAPSPPLADSAPTA
jgi:hypothetical protein